MFCLIRGYRLGSDMFGLLQIYRDSIEEKCVSSANNVMVELLAMTRFESREGPCGVFSSARNA